ncbi:unnamed protein product [Parajaminaea phylloscopi]
MGYKPTRTALVVGASYAGYRAAQQLVTNLPPGWRVVVLERNTHMNHLYAFPRVSVVPNHEKKVFIPNSNIFRPESAPKHAEEAGHVLIHGCLTRLDLVPAPAKAGSLPYGRGIAYYRLLQDGASCCRDPNNTPEDEMSVRYDYLVYALGCKLPPPINFWSTASAHADKASSEQSVSTKAAIKPASTCCMNDLASQTTAMSLDGSSEQAKAGRPPCRGSKPEGVAWIRSTQAKIRAAKSIVVIGAGALGVQFASDIAALYGTETYTPPRCEDGSHDDEGCRVGPKRVTLLCSRDQLLPRFNTWMHERAYQALQSMGVEVLLKARADMSPESLSLEDPNGMEKVIRTTDGREVRGELVLFCTGQTPCTEYLVDALPANLKTAINAKTGMASVNRYLQLAVPSSPVSDGTQPAPSAVKTSDPEGDAVRAQQVALENAEPQTHRLIDNLFVIGDCADAFGALNAGHTAWEQANVSTDNVVRLAKKAELARREMTQAAPEGGESEAEDLTLRSYEPPLPGIKVSLGLDHAIIQHRGINEEKRGKEQGCAVDLNTDVMWTSRGFKSGGESGDWRE